MNVLIDPANATEEKKEPKTDDAKKEAKKDEGKKTEEVKKDKKVKEKVEAIKKTVSFTTNNLGIKNLEEDAIKKSVEK